MACCVLGAKNVIFAVRVLNRGLEVPFPLFLLFPYRNARRSCHLLHLAVYVPVDEFD